MFHATKEKWDQNKTVSTIRLLFLTVINELCHLIHFSGLFKSLQDWPPIYVWRRHKRRRDCEKSVILVLQKTAYINLKYVVQTQRIVDWFWLHVKFVCNVILVISWYGFQSSFNLTKNISLTKLSHNVIMACTIFVQCCC